MQAEQPQQRPSALATQASNLGIPIAIVIAAGLISGAIYLSGNRPTETVKTNPTPTEQQTPERNVAPITEKDHIRGNPNAEIAIIEYSDFDCPFCKIFHETMQEVAADYGTSGKVMWVYRHFPIAQLHPNAAKISEASECVADLGGNDAFWKFVDAVYASRKPMTLQNGSQTISPVDITKLSEFAVLAGVKKNEFDLCLSSGKYAEFIKESITAAVDAGARGTPYPLLVYGGQQGVIEGAQPYSVVKQMIETALAQMGIGGE